jgi:hypothetical protein
MSSGLPATPREGRIIPFPSRAASPVPDAADPGFSAQAVPPQDVRTEAARHYLKFMLPSIPIATFVLSFVYWYLVLGMRLVRPEHVAARVPTGATLVDPTLLLVGALLVTLTTTVLCMAIYFGFLRICALRRPDLPH